MIPKTEWKEFGAPGHFIAAAGCEFRRHTLVGDIVISTVARYRHTENGKYEEIGWDRYGETYVFRNKGIRSCGCPDIDACEIDATCYSLEDIKDCALLDAGHEAMCAKWAEAEVVG